MSYPVVFRGIEATSLVDYPGKIACVFFLPSCNARCPYCHNPYLVLKPETQPEIPLMSALKFLEIRKGWLDAVVISGGEPTLTPGLPEALREIRKLGFLIKLDTNGSRPDVVRGLLEEHLLDFVALDIKAPAAKYQTIIGKNFSAIEVYQTLSLLQKADVTRELRVSVHKSLLSPEDLEKLFQELTEQGEARLVLQQFHQAELIDDQLNSQPTYTDAEIQALAKKLGPGVSCRGLKSQ